MLRFGIELCKIQHRSGRGFVSEHLATATSWEDASVKDLMQIPGVVLSVMDMICYGMVAEDKEGVAPVRKTTKILANIAEVADALSLIAARGGGHTHVHLISGRPKDAAKYPSGFCRAIVKGLSWVEDVERWV